MTPEQIAKLPKRAQDYITLLQRRLEEKTETLNQLAELTDGSADGVYVNDYTETHLPFRRVKSEGVRIVMKRHKIDISSRKDSDFVRVSFNVADCESTLAVLPQATNCIYLVATPSPKPR